MLTEIHTQKVTRSVETGYGQLSPQEQNTINAIAKARLSSFRTLLIFMHRVIYRYRILRTYQSFPLNILCQ